MRACCAESPGSSLAAFACFDMVFSVNLTVVTLLTGLAFVTFQVVFANEAPFFRGHMPLLGDRRVGLKGA